jgi:hypothetical protein
MSDHIQIKQEVDLDFALKPYYFLLLLEICMFSIHVYNLYFLNFIVTVSESFIKLYGVDIPQTVEINEIHTIFK